MSKRSQWCEFEKEERKYIKKRDGGRCIYCGNNGALQIAHIFKSRAKGGKGCRENGVLLCVKCHQQLDNGNNPELTNKINDFCRSYLIKREKIKCVEELEKRLIYNKSQNIEKIDFTKIMFKDKCRNCKSFVKLKGNMPTYYCKFKKRKVSKNQDACNRFID